MNIVLFFLLFVSYVSCDAYKVLGVFPYPVKSHHQVWDPLLKELSFRGHQVTALKGCPMDDPPADNYHEIIVADVLQDVIKIFGSGDSFSRPSFFGRLTMALFFKKTGLVMGELWMKDPGIQKVLKSNTSYDAVLFETSFMQEYFTTLQHKFNAIGIEMATAGNIHWVYWMFGNPADTSYVVDAGSTDYTDHLTFIQRLYLTCVSWLVRGVWHIVYMPKFQRFMDDNLRYPGWESRPSMLEMIANTSLVLVNTDVTSLTYPHPMSPNFIQIGGINVKPNRPLPPDLKEFMDGATDGVIYFTLGSHIQMSTTLGESLRDVFSNVFSHLKQRVLWKWEDNTFLQIPPNVRISKWFPQQDILAHNNLKLFISHGGFLSITESIYYGIPLVGIPIFADQDKNIKFIQDKGIGVHLALENLTEHSVSWAINEILSQPKFKERAQAHSRLLKDKPMTALETAVYWTEYVIRHKGAHHLRPTIATMPWYQQAMIDVYLTIALIILIPLYLGYLMLRKVLALINYCLYSNKTEIKKLKRKQE